MDHEGFEGWLGEEPLPTAREGFRESLRARFLAADSKSTDEGRDSRSRSMGALRKEDVSADLEQHLRNHPSEPQAREAFRASLREQFLAADAAPRAGVHSPRPKPSSGKLLRFAPAAGLAAAAAVLFLLLPRFEKAPRPTWRVASADVGAVVQVDGQSMDPTGAGFREGLAKALLGSDGSLGDLSVTEGVLHLVYGDQLRIDVQPGSQLAFAESGPALQLDSGELYIKTFKPYPGHGLSIETPDSEVAVHGTTLGVLVAPSGTCVCVAEGQVDFVRVRRGVAQVHERHKHFMFRDSSQEDVVMPFPDLEDPALLEAERRHSQGLLDFFEAR